MTPEEWKKLESAFEEAVELDGEELAGYLENVRAEDPDLARNLERMLAEDRTDDQKLLDPVSHVAASLVSERKDPWTGRALGPYRIVRRLAEGGMGTVFLAIRIDAQFDQQVAIKVMSAQLASEEAVTRFRTERQILANLNHTGIGQLLDGGTTDSGLPYLVMEYIDGVPIDDYCDANRLSVTDRLRLFYDVCLAVDYAHRNLVVHRDLKPSNILITPEGAPKLLDFGIAKLLDPDEATFTRVETEEGVRAMTRSFASPEQVRGEAISVATDVYSLGVLLYRLLTGHSPYGEASQSAYEIEQAILETDPRRPSTAVTEETSKDTDVSADEIGANRSSSPRKLKSKLKGDIDNIVLMTMRKEPERRYPSARLLANDIRHYLDHEPVLAHPASIRYRAGKFVQRNKLGVSLAAASLLVITAMTVIYTVNVTEERNRAALEAETAERVSDFLLSLFETADPTQSMGETITARSLLDAGALRIEQELAGQPAIRAAMQDVMGGAYRGLGLYEPSGQLLQQALRTRRELFGAQSADVLETVMKIGNLAIDNGEYEKAEEIFGRALEASQSLNGEDHLDTVLALQWYGWAIYEQGRPDEARPIIEEAMAAFRRLRPDGSFEEASILDTYGWITLNMGDFQIAEESLKRSIAMLRQTVGELHPSVPAAMNHLSYVYQDTGRWDEAEAITREGLRITERVLGDQHPRFARELTTLGWIMENKGQSAEAERMYRQSMAIDERHLPPDHHYLAMDKNNLAGALMKQGRYPDAAELFRDSLQMNQRLLGQDHPESATSSSNLATALVYLGEFEEAEALFRDAWRIRESLYGEDHPFTLITMQGVARIKHTIGDLAESRALFEHILKVRRKALGPDHPDVALTLSDYGQLLLDVGDIDEAGRMVRASRDIYQARFDAAHPVNTNALFVLATAVAASDDPEPATDLFEQALRSQRNLVAAGHPSLSVQLTAFGNHLLNSGMASEALPYLEEALEIRMASFPAGHWQTAVTKSTLGHCRNRLGVEGAGMLLEQGYEELRASLGDAHRYTVLAAERLGENPALR